ncbi:MAG: class I SAM-dependent methyltransferase [Planctomycetota bacterium]
MGRLLSLQTAGSHSTKERAKILVGKTLATIFPRRAAELKASPTNHAARKHERIMMAFLRDQARRNNDARFFETLHQEFWQGEGGAVFSSNCDHRFEDLFLSRQQADFEKLQQVWSDGHYDRIVEIGCCSGLLLQFLTTQLPGVKSAIGIDLNEEQIRENQNQHGFDARIEFVCGDGFELAQSRGSRGTLYVTNGGVMEYIGRNQLDRMLSKLSHEIGDCLFFAVEPIAPDHDWSLNLDSMPFGEELSFSHNYTDAFDSNGFRVLHQRAFDYEQWRWMATLAVS